MEDSPIGLDKWMAAFWMLANCKNGISCHELGTRSGHYAKVGMVHASTNPRSDGEALVRTRQDGGGPESEVEADETFVGGKSEEHAPVADRMRILKHEGRY